MAAPKGHPRYGGREKGTLNRPTQELRDLANKHGCDPFEILILFAMRDHEKLGLPRERVVGIAENGDEIKVLSISPELQQKSARDACEYLHPKRKAVEMSVGKDTMETYEQIIQRLDKQK